MKVSKELKMAVNFLYCTSVILREHIEGVPPMAGYDELADFITADPGLSIYRRFSYLTTKNIIYLQAELVNLEAQLRNIIRDDRNSQKAEKEQFPYSVWHLKHSAESPDSLQWMKVLEIRKTLQEYS